MFTDKLQECFKETILSKIADDGIVMIEGKQAKVSIDRDYHSQFFNSTLEQEPLQNVLLSLWSDVELPSITFRTQLYCLQENHTTTMLVNIELKSSNYCVYLNQESKEFEIHIQIETLFARKIQ